VEQETVVGEAQVLQVFELQDRRNAHAAATVAGCRISEGSIRADGRFRVLRQGTVVSTSFLLLSLQRPILQHTDWGRATLGIHPLGIFPVWHTLQHREREFLAWLEPETDACPGP
jgi:translation initiation factor IF-2